MQQAEEPAAEPEAQSARGLRLVHQGRVVELELVEGVAQRRVVVSVDRVEPGVDHRVGVPVATQRFGRPVYGGGHCVTDPRLPYLLDAGDQVADLADSEVVGPHRVGRDDPDLEHLVDGPGRHHLDPVAVRQPAIDDADVSDDSSVGVVDGVEDQCPRRRVRDSLRRRDRGHDLVEEYLHPLAGLGRHPEHVVGVAPDDVGELGCVPVGLSARQVDLVEHRDDVQIGVQGQIQVGQRLRLDALGRVDQQDGAVAGLERPAHLIGEVDMAGRVDHVEHELGARVRACGCRPRQPHRLALDRDPALALDVHPVEVLRSHGASVDHSGQLQHPVGQCRLAVVDVGDDAEVADDRRVGGAG